MGINCAEKMFSNLFGSIFISVQFIFYFILYESEKLLLFQFDLFRSAAELRHFTENYLFRTIVGFLYLTWSKHKLLSNVSFLLGSVLLCAYVIVYFAPRESFIHHHGKTEILRPPSSNPAHPVPDFLRSIVMRWHCADGWMLKPSC